MTDEEFLAAFEDCTLPRDLWTHAAHIRMAWLCLRRDPFDIALPKVCAAIIRYNAAGGKPGAYHQTVTHAFLAVIDHRMRSASGDDFASFSARNADLFEHGTAALKRHYRPTTLDSDDARARFVEPDLLPFDAA